MPPSSLVLLVSVVLALRYARAQSTTTCKDDSVTWYNSDGLNPCQQYQKLQQTCDPNYVVPTMTVTGNPEVAPDTCAGSACCCNSVAFNLAMMCLSCQQGLQLNASTSAYTTYLNKCSPSLIRELDATVQSQVCANGPVLKRWEYEVYQDDGSWSYEFTATAAENQIVAGSDSSIKCDTTTSSTSASAPDTNVSATTGPSSTSGISVGAVVGAVIGTVIICAIMFFLLWWFWLRRPLLLRRRDSKGGPGDFDLLPSARPSRTISMSSADLARVYVNNPYINHNTAAAAAARPVTQTFSELTLPVPLAVPSDFNYQSSYSGTPFSTQPPPVPGGWRTGAPSVIHSVSERGGGGSESGRLSTPSRSGAAPLTLATDTSRDAP